jgi:hypothetical protein
VNEVADIGANGVVPLVGVVTLVVKPTSSTDRGVWLELLPILM